MNKSGVALGGIIGAILGLGLPGALIGAGIGGFIAFIFGKPLEQYKTDAINSTYKIAGQLGDSLQEQILPKIIQPFTEILCRNLSKNIDRFSRFKPEITDIIAKEKAQQKVMQKIIIHAEEDLAQLQMILNNPDSVLRQK